MDEETAEQLGWLLRRLFKSRFPSDEADELQRTISDLLIYGDEIDLKAVEDAIDFVCGE